MSQAILAVLAAVIAALGTYLAASRKLSGKIATSDAESLWAESAAIRDDYRQQLAAQNARTAELERRVEILEQRNSELLAANVDCKTRLEALERENAGLKQHVESLLLSLEERG